MITPQTSVPSLAKALGFPQIFLKREDLHPFGSHKGRSIPAMIHHYLEKGDRHFVISSSGNAALAAALYLKEKNKSGDKTVLLDIFIGNNAAPFKTEKIKNLEDDHIKVRIKERPLQALNAAVESGSRSLRQSTDDEALHGYESLCREILEIKDLSAIFMGASSGTTAQALASFFLENKRNVKVHIVQTSSCHPLSDGLETYDGTEEQSIADAIVDITAYRKEVLIPLIQKTGGNGWVATNDELDHAQELIGQHAGIDVTPNGALAVVGAMKYAYRGEEIKGATVCIIGGQ